MDNKPNSININNVEYPVLQIPVARGHHNPFGRGIKCSLPRPPLLSRANCHMANDARRGGAKIPGKFQPTNTMKNTQKTQLPVNKPHNHESISTRIELFGS